MHVLPPDLQWQSPCLHEIIAQSDTLWFEAPIAPANRAVVRYNAWFGRLQHSEKAVASLLSPQELKRFLQAIKTLNLDYKWIVSKPLWHADAILSGALLRRKQYYNRHGVEQVLEKQAHKQKIKLRYLESARQQRQMLESLPIRTQHASLLQTLNHVENNSDTLKSLTTAWAEGDIDQLYAILHEESEPAMHQKLIRERNRNWAAHIDQIANTRTETALLVVGAGHISGPDSLIYLLRARGFAVQRIN